LLLVLSELFVGRLPTLLNNNTYFNTFYWENSCKVFKKLILSFIKFHSIFVKLGLN